MVKKTQSMPALTLAKAAVEIAPVVDVRSDAVQATTTLAKIADKNVKERFVRVRGFSLDPFLPSFPALLPSFLFTCELL